MIRQKLIKEYNLNYRSNHQGFIRITINRQLKLIFLLGLLSVISGLMPLSVLSADSKAANDFVVKGQVRLSSGKVAAQEGLDVVLLKYVLNADGAVTPVGPQGRVKTKEEGNFIFLDVNPDLRAGYQLGTRVEGVLYSSKMFFIKSGENMIEKDIIIPGISNSVEELEMTQVTLVIESGLGTVTVTEVLVLNNSTEDRIDTRTKPLIQKLPSGIENFHLMESKSTTLMKHQLDSNVLKMEHVFPIGTTQIIYQYILPALFGSLEIEREFEHSLELIDVFTPVDRLKIKSAELTFSGKQSLNEKTFLSWKTKASDSNRLKFKISNVPKTSLQYAAVSGILLILLLGMVALFYRRRLVKK